MLIQRFLNLLPSDIPRCPVILDVGSCTGEQACEFAMLYPRARIFAFEARPESAEIIRRNIREYLNVELVEAAVCDRDGDVVFHSVSEGNPGASSLFVASGHQAITPMLQTPIKVPGLRLDSWAASREINSLDLVWMDLQGAELLALQGMGHLLATIRAIQIEVTYRELYRGQAMWPDVRSYLELSGLRLVDEWPDPSGYFGDAIFIR